MQSNTCLGGYPSSTCAPSASTEGLQAYPSRTKDCFPVDYSTGSVGLGSAAPLFGALTDRYVTSHFGSNTGGRFISLLGDAELDEGNVWEAVNEPLTRELGNVLWIVDLNRQSLDRVIPVMKARQLEQQFEAAGWQVLELKYGGRLREAFARDGGDLLRARIDEMPNAVYQSLFGASEDVITATLLNDFGEQDRRQLGRLLASYEGQLGPLVQDLGGHDLRDVLCALRAARRSQSPTVLFAYTIKGYGLPMAGHPLNHSALLTREQIDDLRRENGFTKATEWQAFPPESPEETLCRAAADRLARPERPATSPPTIPVSFSIRHPAKTATQAALGRLLLEIARTDNVGERIVTVSPDVSVSTNLGGWINKAGVWGDEPEFTLDEGEGSPLHWQVSSRGQHVELGISEMNLFLALGQLGLAHELTGEHLLPIGTLYDPFVCRGLEGLIYSVYSGSRFVVCGTPSGVTLSREGGCTPIDDHTRHRNRATRHLLRGAMFRS